MRYFILALIIICFTSCYNYWEAVHISNFPKQYTGLDTLIRIDGYYYFEETVKLSTTLNMPIIFCNDGGFMFFHGGMIKSHAQMQAYMKRVKKHERCGNYTLSGDTINVRWSFAYDIMSYEIFSGKFLIENDSTLRRINHVRRGDEIYKFYEYKFDKNK